jgi:hypothetical protein
MTDHFTDEMVAGFRAEVERVIFGVSRLVVDPERFADDADEPMAARGMGATMSTVSPQCRYRMNPIRIRTAPRSALDSTGSTRGFAMTRTSGARARRCSFPRISIDLSPGVWRLGGTGNADARVRSFMIEVRRDLYMDEVTGIKRANFSVVSKQL